MPKFNVTPAIRERMIELFRQVECVNQTASEEETEQRLREFIDAFRHFVFVDIEEVDE